MLKEIRRLIIDIYIILHGVFTVVPAKSDSDVLFCLQLFSKTLI